MSKDVRKISIRDMLASDLPDALALTQGAGWPHRAEDWRLHFDNGRGWVACTEDGRLVATTLLWEFGDDNVVGSLADQRIGTLGLIVVDPSMQGCGIGRLLMNHAMAAARVDTLRLIATEAGLKLYESCGFVKTGGLVQHQAAPTNVVAHSVPENRRIRAVTENDLEALIKLDNQAFGCSRRKLLTDLVGMSEGVLLEDENEIKAFALMRRGGRGLQVGPVIAADESEVIILLSHLIKGGQGFTRIDIPEHARQLAEWLEAIGMPAVDHVTAMQKGATEKSSSSIFTTYGIVTQAFG